MAQSATVSVVLPARNAAATLPAALDSVRSQTQPPWEIILVDHDSTDDTLALMRRAAREDERIRVHTCRGSFIEAVNLAWRVAEGDLIARMDADDVAHPERLARQVDHLSAHPDTAACGAGVRILRRGECGATLPAAEGYRRYERWVNSVITPDQIAAQRFVDSPLPNPTAMIRRPVLESAGGYHDPEWAEDYDFWLRLLDAGHRLGKVDRALLDWFDGENRATRTRARYRLSLFQAAKAHYLARLPGVRERGVALCGAGPIGKEMAGLLREEDVPVRCFVEVNRRQIGNHIAGVPVRGAAALDDLAGEVVLAGAVGQPGARERIRSLAGSHGFREGIDFFSVA